ncbi:MAG TPA: amidase, partial [Kofleriaceae bacterium]|nr:amidase [Kofleriaceae bacterium]
MSSELAFAGVVEIARRVRAKELSARAVTDAFLARIDAHDGEIGSYLVVDHAGARARADEIDAQIAAGNDPGPLAGVPVGIKDVIVTQGLVTTAGSKILDGWTPPYDATAVARLRAAGAVILGKLNCDEFAMGSSNENAAYKACRNPWDTARVPGGSSGGSAAAVAAGLAAATLGTDTGGSIRQPAAFCGVVGLKPTYGRISRYGMVPAAWSLDHAGPFTRSVRDAAVLLDALSGHDRRDPASLPSPVPVANEIATAPRGLRVGIPARYLRRGITPGLGIAPEVAAAFDRAVET